MAENDRHVVPHERGWADRRQGASRPAQVYGTQQEAIDAARERLRNSGGGELNIHGRDGQIREKDSVPPGNDPFPPKG